MNEPYPKSQQLARGERKYRRKVASPKQWQTIVAAKCRGCRLCDRHVFVTDTTIEAHHVIPRDFHGDDVADNIVGLCRDCHAAVTALDPTACRGLVWRLTDAEYAYAIDKMGEAVFERVYRIRYER